MKLRQIRNSKNICILYSGFGRLPGRGWAKKEQVTAVDSKRNDLTVCSKHYVNVLYKRCERRKVSAGTGLGGHVWLMSVLGPYCFVFAQCDECIVVASNLQPTQLIPQGLRASGFVDVDRRR